jgi:rhodanese-related sulfurtransferase
MIRDALRAAARRLLRRAPPIPAEPSAGRTPPTTRAAWKGAPPPAAPPGPPAAAADDDAPLALEVDAAGVAAWAQAGRAPVVIDIREPHELRQGTVDGAFLLPMNDVPGALATLPRGRPLVLVCAAGARSYQVAAWLREQGVEEAWSLDSGVGGLVGPAWPWVVPAAGRFAPGQRVRLSDAAAAARGLPETVGRVQGVSAAAGQAPLYRLALGGPEGESLEGVAEGELERLREGRAGGG